MTRQHATIQLLRHGELTFREFVDITGWTVRQCRRVIEKLRGAGHVVTSSQRAGLSVYSLVVA